MKKIVIIVSVFLVIGIWFRYAEDWHLTVSGAIPREGKVILSQDTAFGKAVVYEDAEHSAFGAIKIRKKLGMFYYDAGRSEDLIPDKDLPFQATGYANEDEEKDSYILGVKVNEDSHIKTIAVGNHQKITDYNKPYEFSMKDIEAHPDQYLTAEVKDGYALFVMDKYTKEGWTIRCFDEEGNMVADKLNGGDHRYTNW